ncbi:hypothetical protein HYT18_03945 [Candidatus Microgenomates bacterium]|nr:hypothetical protein [Candidatus Microgenomates bacterium]
MVNPNLPTVDEFSKIFFDWQSKIEEEGQKKGVGSGGDFRRVFKETIKTIISDSKEQATLSISLSSKLNKIAKDFFTEFKEIKMEDLIYPDTYEDLVKLFEVVDGIVLFTTGDPEYQPRKIEKSGILKMLDKARKEAGKLNTYLHFLFALDKEATTLSLVKEFVKSISADSVMVVLYDDNPEKFQYADGYLTEFENKQNFKLHKIYV